LPSCQPSSIGPVDGGRGHQARGRRLVAAGGQHDAVEREAVQDFDEAQIREIAVQRGGRPAALLGERMHRKLHRNATRVADARFRARREFDVMPVARREIAARLRDADDRPTRLQLFARQTVVHESLDVQRRHIRMRGIVEPFLAAQPARGGC
jgi:hypothetical protein